MWNRLKSISRNPAAPLALYVAAVCALGFYYLVRYPVMAGDTDLWYHLNGGRYFFEHWRPPHDSFFSFVTPPKPWVDFFWLFQAFIYRLHQAWGYQGVAIFRACMFTALLALTGRFLIRGLQPHVSRLCIAGLFGLLVVFLMPRSLLVRPHLFSYLFILLFLFILEYRRRSAWLLPIAALFWVNIHGLAFPVMYLIVLAYLAEYFLERLRRPKEVPVQPALLRWCALALAMVHVTPHGLRLPQLAFTSVTYASRFINEYRPITPTEFTWVDFMPSFLTAFNLMFYTAILAGLTALIFEHARRHVRVSHFLLLIGSIMLVTKGARFTYEATLLSLPLLTSTAPIWAKLPWDRQAEKNSPIAVALISALLLLPVMTVRAYLLPRPRYPFSHRNLPHGVAAFLNHVNVGGRVLNEPNTGGYLQWLVYPRYLIYMDMEVPFLFTDEEFHIAQSVFHDEVALRKFLKQYDPSFITASIYNKPFRKMIPTFEDFILVFFDDAEVLYLNKRHHPDLAMRYGLPTVDPAHLVETNFEELVDEPLAVLESAAQLLAIHPESRVMRGLMSGVYARDHTFDLALEHAQALVANYPDDPIGYLLRGDALKGLGQLEPARAAYSEALERSQGLNQQPIYRGLFDVYRAAGSRQQAYDTARNLCDFLAPDCSKQDLYDFGIAALDLGRVKEAEAVFTYMTEYRLGAEDAVWINRVDAALQRLKGARR